MTKAHSCDIGQGAVDVLVGEMGRFHMKQSAAPLFILERT